MNAPKQDALLPGQEGAAKSPVSESTDNPTPAPEGSTISRFTPAQKAFIDREESQAIRTQTIANAFHTVASLGGIPPDMEAAALHAAFDVKRSNAVAGEDEVLKRYSMAELLALPREFLWLAKGLMAHPTYGQTAGAEKTLKSTTSNFTNVALAAGIPVLGQFAVPRPVPVVVYVGEGGRVPYTQRLERVAETLGVKLADIPLYVHTDVAPIQSEIFKRTLERDLRDLEPGLVVIDPLYAFHGADADPRNLHDEGGLLNSLSAPCVEAGASLNIINHFNKTGTGGGLNRITMAGAAQWVDSWWLLSHREDPDVTVGSFKLLLEIGSRQWGGTEWDLNFELGRFDYDLGVYDSPITFEISPHVGTGGSGKGGGNPVLELVTRAPWEMTKNEILKEVGESSKNRKSFRDLAERGRIAPRKLSHAEGSRTVDRDLWGPGAADEWLKTLATPGELDPGLPGVAL